MRTLFLTLAIVAVFIGTVVVAHQSAYEKGQLHAARETKDRITSNWIYAEGYNDGWNYCFTYLRD